MGRVSCCSGEGIKRGSWTAEEDHKLKAYIESHGEGGWRSLPAKAGLERCGKSCRLRWSNYLKPGIKRGSFTPQEDQTIIKLHARLGNRWAAIARQLPMRTDNEVKNYWNAHLKKRVAEELGGGRDEQIAPPMKKVAASISWAQILNRLATRVTLLDAVKICLAITYHQWVPDNNSNNSSTSGSGANTSTTIREGEEGQCSKNERGEEGAEVRNKSSRLGNCIAATEDDDDDAESNKAAAAAYDEWGLVLDTSEGAGFLEFGDIDTDNLLLFGTEMEMEMGSPFSDSRILLEEEQEDLSTPPPTPTDLLCF